MSLLETDVEEDHGDVGLMISNNGQECTLQIVFNVQKTEACGEPWCLCLWLGISSGSCIVFLIEIVYSYSLKLRLG